jgi:carbamoyltransferase
MIVLGVFTGHDGGAALFDDYKMISAVALERMTRIKGDGSRFPEEAVDECLAVAGLAREDVDALALPRYSYPSRYFDNYAWWDLSRLRPLEQRSVLRQTMRRRDSEQGFFDRRKYLIDLRFAASAKIFFYDHHLAHALTALFHTDWQDAVLYTADGGGDRLFYSARELAAGRLREFFGGVTDSTAFRKAQRAKESLALLYFAATAALGFVPLRHEGKVLGLAVSANRALPKHFDRRSASIRRASFTDYGPGRTSGASSRASSPGNGQKISPRPCKRPSRKSRSRPSET